MRLIDADIENEKLLDFIAEHDTGIQYAIEHKDMTMLEDIFFEYFEAQQIAYDVDKVVEQLDKKLHNYYPSIDHYCLSEKAIRHSDAIEIVKSGGVNNGN